VEKISTGYKVIMEKPIETLSEDSKSIDLKPSEIFEKTDPPLLDQTTSISTSNVAPKFPFKLEEGLVIELLKPILIKKKKENDITDSSLSCEKEPREAKVGVHRIWVYPENQRQGIATKMMDIMRSDFIEGEEIEKKYIAFTQPSLEGKNFAKKYIGEDFFGIFE